MKIKDLIGEAIKPTQVIQLRKFLKDEKGIKKEIEEITQYVITSEIKDNIEKSFTIISNFFSKQNVPEKTCFLIRGDFGTGKSHFLSFLALIFGRYSDVYRDQCWKKLSKFGIDINKFKILKDNDFLVVPIALQHYLREDFKKIIYQRIEEEFEKKFGKKILMSDETQILKWWEKKPETIRDYYLNLLDTNDRNRFNLVKNQNPKEMAEIILKAAKLAEDKPDIEMDDQIICQHLSQGINEINKPSSKPCLGTILLIDEFSEYLLAKRGNMSDPDSDKHRILLELQSLAELAKDYNIFMFISEQQSFKELTKLITKTRSRLIQLNLSMKLFGSIIDARILNEEIKQNNKHNIIQIYNDLKQFIPNSFPDKIPKHFSNIENYFFTCYPFHPLTIEISEKYLQELVSSERAAMSYAYEIIIRNMNEDAKSLITPDTLWDYFFENPNNIAEKFKSHYEFYNQAEKIFFNEKVETRKLQIFNKIIKILLLVSPTGYTVSELEQMVCEKNLGPFLKELYNLFQKNLYRNRLIEYNGKWSINLESEIVGLDQYYVNRLIKFINIEIIKVIIRCEVFNSILKSQVPESISICKIKSEWGAFVRSGYLEFINSNEDEIKYKYYSNLLNQPPIIEKNNLKYDDFAICALYPLEDEIRDFITFSESIEVSEDPRVILWVPDFLKKEELSALYEYISLNILYDDLKNSITEILKIARKIKEIEDILNTFRKEASQYQEKKQDILNSLRSKIDSKKSEILKLIYMKYFSNSNIYFQKEKIPLNFGGDDIENIIREIIKKPLEIAYPNYPKLGFKKLTGRTKTRIIISNLINSEKGIITVAKGKKEDIALNGIGVPLKIIKKISNNKYQFEINNDNIFYKKIKSLFKEYDVVSFSTVFKELRIRPFGLTQEIIELLIASLLFADYIEIVPERGENWTSANLVRFLESKTRIKLDKYKIKKGEIVSPAIWSFLLKLSEIIFEDNKIFQENIKNHSLTKKTQIQLWELLKKYDIERIKNVRSKLNDFIGSILENKTNDEIQKIITDLINDIDKYLIEVKNFKAINSKSGLEKYHEIFEKKYQDLEEFKNGWTKLKKIINFLEEDMETILKNYKFLCKVQTVKLAQEELAKKFNKIRSSLINNLNEIILNQAIRNEWITNFNFLYDMFIKEFTIKHAKFQINKSDFWKNYESSQEFKLLKDLCTIEIIKNQLLLTVDDLEKEVKKIRGKFCSNKGENFYRLMLTIENQLKCPQCNYEFNSIFDSQKKQSELKNKMIKSIQVGLSSILRATSLKIKEKKVKGIEIEISKEGYNKLNELIQLIKNFSEENIGKITNLFHDLLPFFQNLLKIEKPIVELKIQSLLEEIKKIGKIFSLEEFQNAIKNSFNQFKNSFLDINPDFKNKEVDFKIIVE
ncbi:MAG: hypothetical protein ACTSRP_00955 [Candidatus Helarchaeota archaeon]